MREPGFYWVKYPYLEDPEKWEAVEFDGRKWYIAGVEEPFKESDFSEIGDKVITPEELKKLHDRIVGLEETIRQKFAL